MGKYTPPQITGTATTPEPKTRRSISMRIASVAVVLVVFAGLGIYLLIENQKTKVVCDEPTVQQYLVAVRSGKDYAPKLKEIAEKVETKPGYDKDLTCVFIVYQHHAYAQDAVKTRQLLNIFQKLSSEGKRLPEGILPIESLEQMEKYVKSLEYRRSYKGGDPNDDVR